MANNNVVKANKMIANIGKCVDYMDMANGNLIQGATIIGVKKNVLRAGDHRYEVAKANNVDIIFPGNIQGEPYDCGKNNGPNNVQMMDGGRKRSRSRKQKKSRKSRKTRSRKH